MRSLDPSRLSPTAPAVHMTLASIVFAALVLTQSLAQTAMAQSFVQLPDMGSNVGPRLTRPIAQAQLQGRSLFGRTGHKVSFIDNGTAYQFASDPQWGRILLGQWGQWLRGFANTGGPGGALGEVEGIDISARKVLYAADRTHGRVLVSTFSPGARSLVNPASWVGAFVRPMDVAWDGQNSPLTTDYLYVLDDSLSTVSYYEASSQPTLIWTYGSPGSGVGQFSHPTGVCAGKTPATNGGTQFTSAFYVVDRGNSRVVRLDRSAGPTWVGSISIAGWEPVDCAVDFFGNVYVVDRMNSHLYKFTPYLNLLDTYGTYGKGANNLNTLAWPHAISVPCGLKVVNGQSVWYCEGRIITAEQWSDSSGAVEHYLGLAASLGGPPTVGDPWASVMMSSTDNAYVSADVWQDGVGIARTLTTNSLWPAGQFQIFWDGTLQNGVVAPNGNYLFRVWLYSAYGCPNGFSQPWCQRSLYSTQFFHRYCVYGGRLPPGDPAPPAPLETGTPSILFRPVQPAPCGGGGNFLFVGGTGGELGIPQAFGVRQLPGVLPGFSEGLTPLASAPGLRPSLSVSGGSLNQSSDAADAVRAAVSEYGLSALQVNLSLATEVTVEVFDLAGRMLYHENAGMQAPGMYVFHWGGSLDGGGTARPGVYMAVVHAQSRRSVSKLIITAAQAR